MPKWEVCRIEMIELGDMGPKQRIKFVVTSDTPQGEQVIDQSEEVLRSDKLLPGEVRSKLIGRLLADGWEPVSFGDAGLVVAFKRQVQ